MICLRLAGKAGDEIGAKPKDRKRRRQRGDRRRVTVRRIPVPSHAAQEAITPRLQRRVQVRRELRRRLKELAQSTVDFCCLNGRQPKANLWYLAQEPLDQRTQRRLRIRAVRPDVNPCQDNLGMPRGEPLCLLNEGVHAS